MTIESKIIKKEWTEDIERVLEAIRTNSVVLSNYHKERYYYYKAYLKYFKLPLIALSSLSSIASVGLTEYVSQKTVSLITCVLSLVSATIASIELYLGIQKTMETEMLTSRNFMLLAYDIYRVLSLTRENRVMDGKHYLDEKYNDYSKLIENANLVKKKHVKDELTKIPYYAPYMPKPDDDEEKRYLKPFSPISSNDPFINAPPVPTTYRMTMPPKYEQSSFSLYSSGDLESDINEQVGMDKSQMLQLTDVYKSPNTNNVKEEMILLGNGSDGDEHSIV